MVLLVGFVLLLLAAGGCSTEVDKPDEPLDTPQMMSLTAILPGADLTSDAHPTTRIDYQDSDEPGTGVKLTWTTGDAFGAYRPAASGATTTHFTLSQGAGSDNGTFTGTPPTGGTEGDAFCLFYPAARTVKQADGSLVGILAGQMQTGNGSMDHLAAFNFMGATVTDATQPVGFRHLLAMMRFDITLTDYDAATDGNPVMLNLALRTPDPDHPLSEQIALKGNTSLTNTNALQLHLADVQPDANGKLRAYLMMPPTTVAAGNSLVVSVTCAKGTVYRFIAPDGGKEYRAGMRYRATIDLAKADDAVSVLNNNTEKSESLSGSGTAQDPYLINSAGDLLYFASTVSDGETYADQYLRLTTNLMIEDGIFVGIGSQYNYFSGHFDGGGHTVGGAITSHRDRSGFFCYTIDAVVHNLHMAVKLTSTASGTNSSYIFATGGLIGLMEGGQLLHCSNSGAISAKANSTAKVGGLVGELNGGELIGCINWGSILQESVENEPDLYYEGIGGIVGMINWQASLHNCFNYGDIAFGVTPVQFVYMGGIAGKLDLGDEDSFLTLANCGNYGTVTGATDASWGSYAGGLIGYCNVYFSDNQVFYMHNCINRGTVTTATTTGGSNAAAGGLIGYWSVYSESGDIALSNCCTDQGSGQSNPIGQYENGFDPFQPCTDGHTHP